MANQRLQQGRRQGLSWSLAAWLAAFAAAGSAEGQEWTRFRGPNGAGVGQNMDHFQWIVALTRIVSAVFRKGGDVTFLVEELRSVFDPRGGYFKKGGKFMPSLVAEIGDVIENHLRFIGMLKGERLDDHQKAFVEGKRREFEQTGAGRTVVENGGFPDGAQLCIKCQTKAMIQMDGCLTCLNCGESKCG